MAVQGPARRDGAAWLGPTVWQVVTWTAILSGCVGSAVFRPDLADDAAVLFFQLLFLGFAGIKALSLIVSAPVSPQSVEPIDWPRYTVLAALYDEVEVVPQLIDHLAQLDYAEDRIEVMILLEERDEATIAAAQATVRPDWIRIVVVPPGAPKTKPRALNFGLNQATGELVTVYDAEDKPDPGQLREAAMRFASDPEETLGCLQAPLRIRRPSEVRRRSHFFDSQFAMEYAALFEVTLPAMARLGLPFPLGGTSNHFRAEALRGVGGWDSFNVTEDADLGFRLWRDGWRSGIMSSPTWETPPGGLEAWLPQRTRWLKGYMQTWGVHTRSLADLGWRGLLALLVSVGVPLLAAAAFGPALGFMLAFVTLHVLSGAAFAPPIFALGVLAFGIGTALAQARLGGLRAGVRCGPAQLIAAPFYWGLLALAFGHAACRLVTEPFTWDKTAHSADPQYGPAIVKVEVAEAGRQAA